MNGMNSWMDFEQALQNDQSMLSSFQSVVEDLIRQGVSDESELLRRGAEKMGCELHGKGGEPVEALADEALDHVAGGRSLRGDPIVEGFNFNSWLGTLLRDLLKKNSAANAQTLLGSDAANVGAVTLPRPVSPEIGELKCL